MKLGIIGASAKPYAWSQMAHRPALEALKDIPVVAICASSTESAQAANASFHAKIVTDSSEELIKSEDVDSIVVSINVAIHAKPCFEAIAEKKTIICEWPLGKDLRETESIVSAAIENKVKGFVMSQGIFHPVIRQVKSLIESGFLGKVCSVRCLGHSPIFGTQVYYEYLVSRESGGNMLTIPTGHSIHALRYILGDITSVSARGSIHRRSKPLSSDPTKLIECTAWDDISAVCDLKSGAMLTLHYIGGSFKGPGLVWEFLGENGRRIKVEGDDMFVELTSLKLFTADANEDYKTVEVDMLLEETGEVTLDSRADTVARFYSHLKRHLNGDAKAITSTFENALKSYRVVDALDRSMLAGGQSIQLQEV